MSDGHRMEKPATMPYYIYEILLRCWRKQPVDRPTFTEIINNLIQYQIETEYAHLSIINSRLAFASETGTTKCEKSGIMA